MVGGATSAGRGLSRPDEAGSCAINGRAKLIGSSIMSLEGLLHSWKAAR